MGTSGLGDTKGSSNLIIQARYYRRPKRHDRGVVRDKPEHFSSCRLYEDVPRQTKLPASLNLSEKRVQLVE